MLASGEIDAVISARAPEAFAPGGQVVRLYPNYRAEEERFFRKTGVFPIMHLMTIRRAVFEQHPWVAMNLYKMFDEAKRRCFARLRDFTCARIPPPWAAAIADEIAAGYGPDPYPYGIEASRPTIEAFCRYAHDQGVTHRRMDDGDLFPREVRAIRALRSLPSLAAPAVLSPPRGCRLACQERLMLSRPPSRPISALAPIAITNRTISSAYIRGMLKML